MIKQEAKEAVLEALSNFSNLYTEEIGEDLDVYLDLSLDSIDVVECVMEVESVLNISIDDDKANTIRTVKDFFDVVESLT